MIWTVSTHHFTYKYMLSLNQHTFYASFFCEKIYNLLFDEVTLIIIILSGNLGNICCIKSRIKIAYKSIYKGIYENISCDTCTKD